MADPDDFYDLLEVSHHPSDEELRQAYRKKAREYHPDLNNDERSTHQFQVIKKAYEVLSDPSKRATYDRIGHQAYVTKHLGGLLGIKAPELENADSPDNQAHGRSSINEQTVSTSGEPPEDGSRKSKAYVNGGLWTGNSSERRGIARRDELDSWYSAGPRAHLASMIALICYGVGIWRFLKMNQIQIIELFNAFTMDGLTGVEKVLKTSGIGTERLLGFAMEATITRTLDVTFPIGVITLPIALSIVAWQSRRTSVWILVLASVGPIFALIIEYAVWTGITDIPFPRSNLVWIVLVLVIVFPTCVTLGWSVLAYCELT